MKLRIIRNVMVAGERKDAGSIVEVEAKVASLLLGLGKAEVVVDEEPAKPAPAAKATKAKSTASEEG